MTTYNNVFGGTVIYPSDVSYRAVSLTADTQLQWPTELATGTNIVAQIMNVTATAGPWDLKMPSAVDVSVGETTLIFNVGSNAFTVTDTGGNTIVSISPGLAYQIFLTDNTTANGVWSQVNYGAGTSSATAGSLAGPGIKALGTALGQSMGITTFAVNYTFQVTPDRAGAYVWTGGAGTVTLPLAADAGNDWFVHLRNNGTGAITLTPSGSDTVNSASSLVFNPGDSAIVACSGSAWFTIGFGQSADFTFDYSSISLTGASDPYTLTGAELNRIAYNFGGTLTANINVIVPTTIQQYWVTNATSGGYDITVKTAAGTGITIGNGEAGILYCNGTNVVEADTGGVGFPISVANGGTGATDATGARTNLSAAKTGVNGDITQITALSDGGASSPAVTFGSENNTGVYRVSAGVLGFSIAGTLEASITANGVNVPTGNDYRINGTSVLNATTLGSAVVNSSLTSVGTLTSGTLGAGFTTVAVARGGTGLSSTPTNGQLLVGNGTGYTLATITAGTGVSITNGAGSITIDVTGGGMVYPGAGIAVSTGSAWTTSLTAPAGALVGTTATQTLTNKTISADNNTLSGIAASSFVLSNASGNIDGAAAQKVIPSGAVVGTTDSQSLTNKTLTTGNTLDAGTSVSDTGTIAATSPGFRGMPQSSNTTLALTDAGKHIYTSSNVTIPANSGTAFPVGTAIVVANSGSSTLTISITTDTLRQSGTTNTGTRTLAAYGIATLVKVTSTVWFISGNVT